MDPITHGLLGACAAQASLPRRITLQVLVIGALAAMAPDLDIFINSKTDPLLFFIYHRHFTHSLFFIPFGGLLVAGFICLFKRVRQHWKIVLFAAGIGFATHGLLDACTSYGTLLLWPLSDKRYSWDIIAIVDPLFTIILLLGILGYSINHNVKALRIALVFAACYLLFGTYQHHRASERQQSLIAARGQTASAQRVMPGMGQLILWYSFYMADGSINADQIFTPLGQPYVRLGKQVPKYTAAQLPDYIKNSPSLMNDYKVFTWFTDGYVAAFNLTPLTLADMRYVYSYQPLTSLWGIIFPERGSTRPHIHWRTKISYKPAPARTKT